MIEKLIAKRFKHSWIFFTLISSVSFSSLLNKEDLQLPSDEDPISNHQLYLRHREANGIGYNTGYSTLGAFFSNTYHVCSPFLDLRAHLFNDGKWAANGGLGLRVVAEKTRRVIGANVFYDYRAARHKPFQQVGAGLEALGAFWDMRLNGYLPVGKTYPTYRKGFTGFSENYAFFTKRQEIALKGIDFSLGRSLVRTKYVDLHATLDGYYFSGKFHKRAGGAFLRVNARFSPFFGLEIQQSYDSLFKWITQGELTIKVPFGPCFTLESQKCRPGQSIALAEHLVEPVPRFEMIVTDTRRKKAIALDPDSGQPLTFLFVNNLANGNGTFANPFGTLLQAQNASLPGNVIYVFSGDGTTTGMNQGILLKNNQILQGSGNALIVTTNLGVIEIPAQTTTIPAISGGINGTVALANNNTVNGFNISGTNGGQTGIFGLNVNNAIITNNIFNAATLAFGVDITNPSGQLLIDQDLFFSGGGINLTGITSGVNATIQNSFFATPNADSINVNAQGTSNSILNVLSNNVTAPSQDALVVSLIDSALMNITVSANAFSTTSTLNAGLAILTQDNAVANSVVQHNVIQETAAGSPAAGFAAADGSTQTGYVFQNAFNSVNGNAMIITAIANANANFSVVQNSFFSANQDAYNSNSSFSSTITLALRENQSGVGSPTTQYGYTLQNLGPSSNFFLISPNGTLAGAENLNIGTFNLQGTISPIFPP